MPYPMEFQRAADSEWRRVIDAKLTKRYQRRAEDAQRKKLQEYLDSRSLAYFAECMGGQRLPDRPGLPPGPRYKAPPHAATAHPRPFLAPTSSSLIYADRSEILNPHLASTLRPLSAEEQKHFAPTGSMLSVSRSAGYLQPSTPQATPTFPSLSPRLPTNQPLMRTHSTNSFSMLHTSLAATRRSLISRGGL